MSFFKKIPVGKDPGNLQVHPCLPLAMEFPFKWRRSKAEIQMGMNKVWDDNLNRQGLGLNVRVMPPFTYVSPSPMCP